MTGLRRAREAVGFTQQRVADVIGVTIATVSRWESGDRDPSSETLVRLAEVLGVTVDALLRPDVTTFPRTAADLLAKHGLPQAEVAS